MCFCCKQKQNVPKWIFWKYIYFVKIGFGSIYTVTVIVDTEVITLMDLFTSTSCHHLPLSSFFIRIFLCFMLFYVYWTSRLEKSGDHSKVMCDKQKQHLKKKKRNLLLPQSVILYHCIIKFHCWTMLFETVVCLTRETYEKRKEESKQIASQRTAQFESGLGMVQSMVGYSRYPLQIVLFVQTVFQGSKVLWFCRCPGKRCWPALIPCKQWDRANHCCCLTPATT